MKAFMRRLKDSPYVALWCAALALVAALWFLLEIGKPRIIVLGPFANLAIEEPFPALGLGHQYIEIVDSCGASYEGACVRTRAGPGLEYPIVDHLRAGIVLRVEGPVVGGMRLWYKIVYDEPVRYPERLVEPQYVAADFVRHFFGDGVEVLRHNTSSGKRILIDRSEQTLYAYEGENLFLQTLISTGHELTPTPRGVFTIYKKTPTRYMQGPLPSISDQFYDLPGVPWNLYFTKQGGAIHGAYWHNNFGQPWSHGCVNLPLEKARALYSWAEVGIRVTVRD